MLNLKATKILSTVMAGVISLGVMGTSLSSAEASSHRDDRPRIEQRQSSHDNDRHRDTPRNDRHDDRRSDRHDPQPRHESQRHDDNRDDGGHSQGEVNTAGVVGLILGGIIGAVISNNS